MTDPQSPSERSGVLAAAGPCGVYDLVLAAFVGVLLISNVAATKLIQFGPPVGIGGIGVLPIVADGGAFLFPVAYILGDVLAEVYGARPARRAIVMGFVMAAIMSLTFLAVDAAPPADAWPAAEAWRSVLGFVPRVVVASLVGFLAGQVLNAHVLVWIKARFGARRLWVRLLASTVVGEFVDTLLFCAIAFGPLGAWLGGGSLDAGTLANYVVVGATYKVVVEVLLLPVTYAVVGAVRRREGLSDPGAVSAAPSQPSSWRPGRASRGVPGRGSTGSRARRATPARRSSGPARGRGRRGAARASGSG